MKRENTCISDVSPARQIRPNFWIAYAFLWICGSWITQSYAIEDQFGSVKPLLVSSENKIAFYENKGQVRDVSNNINRDVLFIAEQNGTKMFLTPTGIVYQFSQLQKSSREALEAYAEAQREVVGKTGSPENGLKLPDLKYDAFVMNMEILGASASTQIIKKNKCKDYINDYRLGVSDIYAYEEIVYRDIYPGIDWVVYTNHENSVKYDFIVHPGADPSQIRLKFNHHEGLEIDRHGNLLIKNRLGRVIENAPLSFQEDRKVNSHFKLDGDVLSFEVGNYNSGKTLVIDPLVSWATYFGGSDWELSAFSAADSLGNFYVVGATNSASGIFSNGFQSNIAGSYDIYLVKFDSLGNRIWATYYGGSDADEPKGIKLDGNGDIFIVGTTLSSTQFTTSGIHQETLAGGQDAFIVKFSNSGQRLWATYYGGNQNDFIESIDIDVAGNVIVGGRTFSDSNIAFSAFQSGMGFGNMAAFLAKFTTNGAIVFGTYIGGFFGNSNALGVCIDTTGNIYVTGFTEDHVGISFNGFQNARAGYSDMYLLKFNPAGQRIWGTYYGGNGDYDYGRSCACDGNNNVYLYGNTDSPGLGFNGFQNTHGGSYDAIVAKFNSTGSRLWASYYGGSNFESATNIVANPDGFIAFVVQTSTSGFGTSNGFQQTPIGSTDGLVVVMNTDGTRLWSSYFGTASSEQNHYVSRDPMGNLLLSAATMGNSGFTPINAYQSANAGGFDAIIMRIANGLPSLPPCNQPGLPSLTSIIDSVCPGDSISIVASGSLGDATHWQWFQNSCGGASVGQGDTLRFAPANSGWIYARGEGGCVTTSICDSIYVTVVSPVSGNTISGNQTLCAPLTADLITGSLPNGGNGVFSYIWESSSDGSIWSATGVTTQNLSPGVVSTQMYFRRFASSFHCSAVVSNTVSISIQPISNLISSSQTINYEGIPSGFTGITNAQNPNYIWETSRNNFHWNVIQGAVNANYAESNNLTQWAWYRRKIAVAGCDTSTSNVVLVQLNNLLSDSITLTSNGPLCTPTPLYLNVNSTIPGLTYQWTGPNGFTATGFNPSIPMTQEANTGVYRCVATHPVTQDSFVATLHVWVSPIMSTLNVSYNQPVCQGSTLTISAAGMPGVTYVWTGPNGFTSDVFAFSRSGANNSMNGIYNLVASSPGCGSITRSLTVSINTIPNPMPGSNGPICASNVLSLTSSIPAGSSALWAGPNAFSSALYQPSISNAQTIHSGVYTLTVTRPGCNPVVQTTSVQVNTPVTSIAVSSNSPVCASGTLQLSATGSTGQYQWFGPNGYNSTSQNPSISNVTNLQNGIYTLQVVSPGCGSTSRTTNVQIITPGSISAGSNSPICAGTTLTLTSTSVPGATVLWEGPNGFNSTLANPSIGGAQTIRSGVYTVTITSPGCTPSVGTTTVTVSSPVNTLAAVSNTPVCEGSTINLSVPLVSGVNYSWSGPLAFTATGNSVSVPNAALANAGNYVLSMTSPGCASVNRTLNVAVRSSSAAIAGSNSPRCTGNVLYLTVNSIAGATYLWQGPNGFSSAAQNPALSNVQPVQSGDYSLTVSFAGCGSLTQSTPVVVYPNAAGIQISAAQTLCSGSTLTLTGTSVNGATMSWVGPNAFTATGATANIPVTTVPNAGRYAYSVSMPGCGTVTRFSNVTIMNASAVSGTITSPLCTGAPMYMNAAFIAGASYEWSSPDGFFSTQKSPSRIQVTAPMAGVYTLSVNVPGCGTVTQTIPVTINVCRDGQDIEPSEPNLELLTEEALQLNVYPNPFERELSYASSGLSLVRVQLLDLNGRVMHQITQPESHGVIPGTETLPAGVYFLRFETAQGYRVVKVMRQ